MLTDNSFVKLCYKNVILTTNMPRKFNYIFQFVSLKRIHIFLQQVSNTDFDKRNANIKLFIYILHVDQIVFYVISY